MKLYRYLLSIVLLSGLFVSCSKEYDRPPLTEPEYTKAEPNITIAKLKSLYSNISDPILIDVDYVVRGVVVGNDISGNIYKQLYIQDETGGINIGIDQNSMYTEYRVGQELIIHVKGLSMVKYGEQLQIGYDKTNANRIPWEVFKLQAHKNKFPKASNAEPKTITLDKLDASMVNTLVKLENVYFQDGGNLPFSNPDATTNRILKDGSGRSIIVRNSNYANFAANTLPSGGGTVVAVLSKFRSDFQLFLRSADDCQNFGQPIPGNNGDSTPPAPSAATYYTEGFGAEVQKSGSYWPYFEDYKGLENKTVFYNVAQKTFSIRKGIAPFDNPHVWFAANKDLAFTIEKIDTSAGAGKKLVLTFDVMANLYNDTDQVDLNAFEVTVDGVKTKVPSQLLTKAKDDGKAFKISIANVPAKKDLVVVISTIGSINTVGLRVDNIAIAESTGDVVILTPKN